MGFDERSAAARAADKTDYGTPVELYEELDATFHLSRGPHGPRRDVRVQAARGGRADVHPEREEAPMTELTQEAIDRAKSILVFEQRVLQHRVEGLTAEQSAERLEVHASTVEACRKHLLLTDGRAWRAGKRGASKRQRKQAAGLAELRMR